ncbi:putative pentatricopeptide repeat-containing protein At3g47840 [Phoenix dactylifera]|uniref:Pentatricopeptide repeat-containing protein At3g47840 n=1 Tax=Phoenix dactylifera TaxID=42345 RepID=A0A8B7CEG2_PHODC|nr:putative pentatricopeptide repeat-containing protein At3g47840 [Phoenix dactylifera]
MFLRKTPPYNSNANPSPPPLHIKPMVLPIRHRFRTLRFAAPRGKNSLVLPVHLANRPFSAEPIRSGPPPSPYEDNARLRTLVKSDRLRDARRLFDEMPHRDEISWTTLISGYVRAADSLGALSLFSRMLSEPSLSPDPFVLSLAFKACAADPVLRPHGECLHARVLKTGVHPSSVFVATSLLDMYSKSGYPVRALQVFDETRHPNAVSWTGAVATLVRAARPRDALLRFASMLAAGVPCDSHTYAVALKACADAAILPQGREIHSRTLRLGLDATPFVANTLAALYLRCGHLRRGLTVLNRLRSRDVAAWTTIISTHVQLGRETDAIYAFIKMRAHPSDGSDPNEYTYAAVLSACAGLVRLTWGEQIHGHAIRRGFSGSKSVANALVTLYARTGRLDAADILFRETAVKDIVSWSAIISGHAGEGHVEKSFALFSEMRVTGPAPNEFTLSSLLSACAGAAMLDAGRQIHAHAIAEGLEADAMVTSALITMYSKSGSIEEAERVFARRRRDEVVSWTAMINGYAEHGRCQNAVELFHEMPATGLKPDGVAFIGVLTACCHGGMVDRGLRYFEKMGEYGVEKGREHYGCVVDMLVRAGRVSEAEGLAAGMPVGTADGVVWTAVMRGWASRGNEEAGRRAAARVMELEPQGAAGAHVVLANLYAGKGRWGEAAEERKRMRKKGVRKGAGWSWVAVGGGEGGAVFVAGDRSHARREDIYEVLALVYYEARRAGYVPELDLETEEE